MGLLFIDKNTSLHPKAIFNLAIMKQFSLKEQMKNIYKPLKKVWQIICWINQSNFFLILGFVI